LALGAKGSPAPDLLDTAFDQQFVTIAGEAPFRDFAVTWSYRGDAPPPVTLRGIDRSLSADRPERPVSFISAARLAPARHQPQLAAQILAGVPDAEAKPLLENYLKRLRDVLQKPYRAARWQGSASGGLAICVFAVAGLPKPDISILSDEFLEDVRRLPQKRLAVEVLNTLLSNELKTRERTNIVQSRAFSDMLERSIRAYQNRAIETVQVIEELIELARDLREAGARGDALGLLPEELAFYEALEVNDSAVKVLGDETLKAIARELVDTIRRYRLAHHPRRRVDRYCFPVGSNLQNRTDLGAA
jgi:hypothetical protein